MKFALFGLGLVLSATAPASAARDGGRGLVTYRCGDLVVVGRPKNLGYEHVDIEGDLLGHGWITARVQVRRVLSGHFEVQAVSVRYFAHTYYRDDGDFVFVINRAVPSKNLIRSAHFIGQVHSPRLAPTCR